MRPKNIGRWLYWVPRVLSILFLLFLAMFSLDIFGNGYGFFGTIIGLFMHNIPVFILAFFLWIGWKREWILGLVFVLFVVWYESRLLITALINGFEPYYFSWSLIIAGPAIIIGVLFFMNFYRRKKRNKI